MALTNNNLEMIKAIAKNDIHSARKAALASLVEDTSKKNAWATDYYRKMLVGNASILMSNLPSDMQTFLVGEAPGGFMKERYYVRPLEKQIAENVRKMKLVADEMSARRIPYKNTTLLYGASGTGKTELGRYIAHELNLPFFYISFVSTIDSYMGSTAKNIHKVFEFCKSIPCVLMLDEIDCVARRRDSTGSRGADGELERTTITIMQEMDNLPNHVTLIAATNRMDMVDEALLRRFSIKQEIEDMEIEDRKRMIKQFLKATNTEKYVTESQIDGLANVYSNPGQIMPELTKSIGKGIFEEKKDEILLKEEESTDEKTNIFEVTYSWKQNITAENEEDAIAIARHESMYSARHGNYTAKRAEFLGPAEDNKKGGR